ncbi:MAG TPA: hypothetical protein DDY37_05835 [Legionella sp.]|nr:hypothetical protein [Legionella sp.]
MLKKTILNPTYRYVFILVAVSLLIRLLSIGSNDLLVEEAYYWNYAAHLDIGYLDHPPMVAVLIKLSTMLFGTNEFGVRIPSLLCWLITVFFSMKLTRLIKPGCAPYALLLLAILPFFFLHSLVITPDIPLIACWSAALYFLYRALVLDHASSWYMAGTWLGLGMLSKYSIVLLGPATLLYSIITPEARKWFSRKEPYACLFITAALFTPVIYWNATHEWASFAFQSTRRFHATDSFSLHQLLGLFVIFLTPLGVLGFWEMLRKNAPEKHQVDNKTVSFLKVFTLTPLVVFSLFSVTHMIKFNWIGPGLLAMIPWLAILLNESTPTTRKASFVTAVILLMAYSAMIFCMVSGYPNQINLRLFSKYIAWNDLTRQIHAVAKGVEDHLGTSPLIVPLDLYNIGSELSFYQAQFLKHKQIKTVYKIIGRDRFGHDSLMYQYWSKDEAIAGKILILISEKSTDFHTPEVTTRVTAQSAPIALWSHSQGASSKIRAYYYQIVRMNG